MPTPQNALREYVTIEQAAEHEIVVKKSRFICSLFPVETQEQAVEKLAKVRKKHYNATHNCSAMVIGADSGYVKASDDGEPQGTAGIPMLDVLQKSKVTDILAVVTRYFGGTMLGAGGLVRAYGRSVSEGLARAQLIRCIPADEYKFVIPYNDYGKLCSIASEFGVSANGEFMDNVTVHLVLPQADRQRFCDRVTQAFLGAQVCCITGECYIRKKV